jgi:hypothetical protein
LTAERRAYEYEHQYGLGTGRGAGRLRPADSRSGFVRAFDELLRRAVLFYADADDPTINADAVPLLNALRDVHLLLSEGAHNQFGDLPRTARGEMLMEQWLLARPEFDRLLPGRPMGRLPRAVDVAGARPPRRKPRPGAELPKRGWFG